MNDDRYTKLYSSIVLSSIWDENNATRITWITLLALADYDGTVMASVSGLATVARLSIRDVESSLEKLKSPDVHSRTPDNDGRRIADIDGGWLIINHCKYRDKGHSRAEYYRKWREQQKDKGCAIVAPRCAQQNETHTDTDTDTYTNIINTPLPPKGDVQFDSFWKEYPKKIGKKAARREWNKIRPTAEMLQKILGAVRAQKTCEQWTKERGQFIPHPRTWLSQGRWDDETTVVIHNTIRPLCACGCGGVSTIKIENKWYARAQHRYQPGVNML
jgi:hypothetical protein